MMYLVQNTHISYTHMLATRLVVANFYEPLAWGCDDKASTTEPTTKYVLFVTVWPTDIFRM